MISPEVFRKGEASSCLVVGKTWKDIINKPAFLDEMVVRVVNMMNGAEDVGLLTKATTLRELKEAINKILLRPLQEELHIGEDVVVRTPGSVLADAFWDEIPQTTEYWVRFKEAITRAYEMKNQIAEHQPLTDKDTLMSTKNNFNDTVVKPMLGIKEDE